MDALTKILAGKEEIYPPKKEHTKLKINSLRGTNFKLDIVAPFMVGLALFIVLRIIFEALVRFPNPPNWALGMLGMLVLNKDRLRHSKFVGLREDKDPRSVVKEHGDKA